MRSSLLSASVPAFALCSLAIAQAAPTPDSLREDIRRIVREEVQAALREMHGEMAGQHAMGGMTGGGSVGSMGTGRGLGQHAENKRSVNKHKEGDEDSDHAVEQMGVEMQKLDDVVNQLEIIVDGEKIGGLGALKGSLKLDKPLAQKLVLTNPEGAGEVKAFEIKPENIELKLDGNGSGEILNLLAPKQGKAGARAKKAKSDDDDEPEIMSYVIGGDSDGKAIALTPAKKGKAKKAKGDDDDSGTLSFVIDGDNDGKPIALAPAKVKYLKAKGDDDDEPEVMSFVIGDDNDGKAIALAPAKRAKAKKAKGDDDDSGTMSFRIDGGGKGFAFAPAAPKGKGSRAKSEGAKSEEMPMTFRITCENGKCKIEQVGGDGECCAEGNGDCTFVIKTDCDDGKCSVQVVGGDSESKAKSKDDDCDCCSGEAKSAPKAKTLKAKLKAKAKAEKEVGDDDDDDDEGGEHADKKAESKPMQIKLPAIRVLRAENAKDARSV